MLLGQFTLSVLEGLLSAAYPTTMETAHHHFHLAKPVLSTPTLDQYSFGAVGVACPNKVNLVLSILLPASSLHQVSLPVRYWRF